MVTEIDPRKVDDAALALLHLTLHEGSRAWKTIDWETMNRLHERGLTSDPASGTKSVVLTEEGLRTSEQSRQEALRQGLAGC
jgi:uncharacterized protein DUF6429